MLEIGQDVAGAKSLDDRLRGTLNATFADVHPQVVEFGIVQLHIRRVQTEGVRVVGVIEEETREVVPIGLKDPGAGRGVGRQPGRSLGIKLVWLRAFQALTRGI